MQQTSSEPWPAFPLLSNSSIFPNTVLISQYLYAIGSTKNAQVHGGEVLAMKTLTQVANTVYAMTGMAGAVGGSTCTTTRPGSYMLLCMPTLEHAQNTGRILASIAQTM